MAWTTEPSTFTTWGLDRSGLGEVQRLTEDGRLRVTEQTIVRIIERFPVTWNIESNSINPWTQE